MEDGFIIFVLHATNKTPKYPCQLYYSFLKNIYLYIWLHWALVAACRIFSCSTWALIAWIEPSSPALGAWSLSHWTIRELPVVLFFCLLQTLISPSMLEIFQWQKTITLSFINSLCFTLTLAEVSFISNRPEFVSSTNKENLRALWKEVLQNIDLSKY